MYRDWITRNSFVQDRIVAICLGLLALVVGIVLSSTPWVDHIILKQLPLSNGSMSFQHWQKPNVIRLTKIYIFNVTNPEGFLQYNEKPKLQEIGPFVFRQDMEKVNVVFHNNGTVSFQHKIIFNYMPQLSQHLGTKLMVPNIPLLIVSTLSKSLPTFITMGLSIFLREMDLKPFISVTAQELFFGYDDLIVSLGYWFLPKSKRPMSKLGLLLGRNGTLKEVSTIFTGHTSMKEFGLINRLNGFDQLPYWPRAPCNSIIASEGSIFPPRDQTGADIIHVWHKDLCRTLPLQYRGPVEKWGIKADLYTPLDMVFSLPSKNTSMDNECFCSKDMSTCPAEGLQNISPCQYSAPVYVSFPHFYKADPKLLDAVEGLKPVAKLHETYIKIQPKLGVPIEAKARFQLNLKVEQQSNISTVSKFPDIVFPILWLEDGVDEIPPSIWLWIYLTTTVTDIVVSCITYGIILVGLTIIITVFVKAYNTPVLTQEAIELCNITLRRDSFFLKNSQQGLIFNHSSVLLNNNDINEKDNVM